MSQKNKDTLPNDPNPETLPPFVVKDRETGDLQVELTTLPQGLLDVIRQDRDLDNPNRPGSKGGREWYHIRQGALALRLVTREDSTEAKDRLEKGWLADMPEGWEQYVEEHLPEAPETLSEPH